MPIIGLHQKQDAESGCKMSFWMTEGSLTSPMNMTIYFTTLTVVWFCVN
jgi:hypothetical protein